MPNGGTDCCGTCCFGEPITEPHSGGSDGKVRQVRCALRCLTIDNPFYRYCINHPRHNPQGIRDPLGPVYEASCYPYQRTVWMPAPDSPEIRKRLIALVEDNFSKLQGNYYFSHGMVREIVVFEHLAALKEKGALPGLAGYLRTAREKLQGPNAPVLKAKGALKVKAAIKALLEISEGAYLAEAAPWLYAGLESMALPAQAEEDMAVIRLGGVESLKYCPREEVIELLKSALSDPHSEIRENAAALLENEIYGE